MEPSSKYFIVRHGQSTYNAADHNEELKKIRDTSIDYVDTPLSDFGVDQASKAQIDLPNLELVLVSPLKRAMQTAYYVFKDHPKFDKILFKLVPDMREGLGSTCDIGSTTDEAKEFAKQCFPNLDTTLMPQQELWFLENIESGWRFTFKRRVKVTQEEMGYKQAVLTFMRSEYQRETKQHLKTRMEKVLKLTKELG